MSRARRSRPPRRPPEPAPAAPGPRLGRGWAAAGLALLHLAVVLLLLAPGPYEGGDNAAYLALARSLLEDGSYRELWDPAARPHTQYPPGWPLILAGAMAAGVKPWTGFKVLAALFSAAAVGLSYLWARRVSTRGVALAAGMVLALGPGVVNLGRWELSDVPFWAFSMLALWGLSARRDATAAAGATVARYRGAAPVAAGAAGVLLAYGTRSAGLPLVAAAVLWLAWSRRWRAAGLVAAVVAPFALAWAARGRAVGSGGYGQFLWYVDPYRPALGRAGFGELAERMLLNVGDYLQDHLPHLLTGYRSGAFALGVGVLVAVLAAAGWALRVRRREAGLAEWWLPLYLAPVLLWPNEWASDRLLLPVLPVLLVLAGEAVVAATAQFPRPLLARRAVASALAGVWLLAAVPGLVVEGWFMARCRAMAGPLEPYACMRDPAADYLELARSVRGSLPPGAAVIARKPTLWWAEAGYPARVFPYRTDPDTLLAEARRAGARYVVLDAYDNLAQIHLAPTISRRPQAFCVMRSLGPDRASLLGILPGADTMPDLRSRPRDEVVEVGFDWCGAEFWAAGAAPPEAR